MSIKRPPLNVAGKRSGNLVALHVVGADKWGNRLWLCECDCGRTSVVAATQFGKVKYCGCDCPLKEVELQRFDRTRVELKPGRTYEEFILKKNENVPYTEICEYLGIDFYTARATYDKVCGMSISDIGALKPAGLMRAKAKPATLQTVKTGENWRAAR